MNSEQQQALRAGGGVKAPPGEEAQAWNGHDRRSGDEPRERPGCGWGLLIVLLVLAATVGGGALGVREVLRRGWVDEWQRSYVGVGLIAGKQVQPADPEREVQLFYVVDGRALASQRRRLREAAGTLERVQVIAREITNPSDPGLYRSPLTGGAAIRGVYLFEGIVWLDLSEEFRAPEHPTPLLERLTVYALVNSFLLNDTSLQGVQIMIGGGPVDSAWGWIDLSQPLGRNLSLIG